VTLLLAAQRGGFTVRRAGGRSVTMELRRRGFDAEGGNAAGHAGCVFVSLDGCTSCCNHEVSISLVSRRVTTVLRFWAIDPRP
jgi:hypothetical protein